MMVNFIFLVYISSFPSPFDLNFHNKGFQIHCLGGIRIEKGPKNEVKYLVFKKPIRLAFQISPDSDNILLWEQSTSATNLLSKSFKATETAYTYYKQS